MDDGHFYFSSNLDKDTGLFLTPLTDDDAVAAGLCSDTASGYFLYERSAANPTAITILAQVETDEAAFTLSRMLNMD